LVEQLPQDGGLNQVRETPQIILYQGRTGEGGLTGARRLPPAFPGKFDLDLNQLRQGSQVAAILDGRKEMLDGLGTPLVPGLLEAPAGGLVDGAQADALLVHGQASWKAGASRVRRLVAHATDLSVSLILQCAKQGGHEVRLTALARTVAA